MLLMNNSSRNHTTPRLGVDIGRVIIDGDGPDTSFIGGSEEDAMRAPAVAGAVSALAELTRRFEGRVWLVSKCGPRIQERTRRWLAHHRFFQATGIAPDHLFFCRDRKEKAPICARLGIGVFVDDRVDVLVAMEGVVGTRLLFGASRSPVPGLVATPTWVVARELIEAGLSRPASTSGPRGTPQARDR